MTDIPPSSRCGQPRRHVTLALLSARDEVLVFRSATSEHFTLPHITVAWQADEQVLSTALAQLRHDLLQEDTAAEPSAWLGRFATPFQDSSGLDMLEVHVARLGEARLRHAPDTSRAWAPLRNAPPENTIDPAIELHVMPALALLLE